MSQLLAQVRKDDNDPQQVESISAQMDALMLQDYQNMQLDQFEQLDTVGMFLVAWVILGNIGGTH
jgi:uncharacterized protein involved in exopolysaccharide biosynthesis